MVYKIVIFFTVAFFEENTIQQKKEKKAKKVKCTKESRKKSKEYIGTKITKYHFKLI